MCAGKNPPDGVNDAWRGPRPLPHRTGEERAARTSFGGCGTGADSGLLSLGSAYTRYDILSQDALGGTRQAT